MPEVGLVNCRLYKDQIHILGRSRPDVEFSFYNSLDSVGIVHSLFVVDLNILKPGEENTYKKFISMSHRLIDEDGGRDGLNFSCMSKSTILLLPTRAYVGYVCLECGGGQESYNDLLSAISRLTMHYGYQYFDYVSLSQIIDTHLPKYERIKINHKNDVSEITSFDKDKYFENHKGITDRMKKITDEIVIVCESVRGDNSILGKTIKGQLISTLEVIRIEINAPLIDKTSVTEKTKDADAIIKRISSLSESSVKIVTGVEVLIKALKGLFHWIT